MDVQLNNLKNGPTAVLDAQDNGNDYTGDEAMEETPQAINWLDDTSPPAGAKRTRPRRKARKKRTANDVPADIDDAVTAWFEYTWEPANNVQRQWSAEDWWRLNESSFPMIAKLARRVLATQVR